MQQSVFQPANQADTSYQQQYDHLMHHLTVDGKAPEPEIVHRILSAKPKASRKSNLQTSRPFSLLR